ncbi:Acyl-CoA N-acyltransferase [Penicillium waksmanii]|uniref:Acyl-CoA N-acyltransferase n=1 Tax=Penicillium waksmanii TaxID=69791 RepID=UPI0025489138|nr:Acyl-CoA N-acyltransferase [Penicillium waksmanii]KAJ5973326.1 Acyl-CoA N-acyltransferase [Penicillium waksmanii]
MPTKEGRVTKNQARKSGAHQRRVQHPRRTSISKTRRVSQQHTTDLPLVERTNALATDQFISQYVTPLATPTPTATGSASASTTTSITGNEQTKELPINSHTLPTPPSTQLNANLNAPTTTTTPTPLAVYSSSTIPPLDLEACLDLIEQTSGDAYTASGIGWSRPKKRKEMKLPDMKYLLVRGDSEFEPEGPLLSADDAQGGLVVVPDEPVSELKSGSGSGLGLDSEMRQKDKDQNEIQRQNSARLLGFLSFMVTYEDGKEVVYCYEIHLSPIARGRGLGGVLMSRMEGIGRLIGLEKAMLTVFKSNVAAREFYRKGGYEVDENSPQPRTLRNGTVKEWDYEILSKRLM